MNLGFKLELLLCIGLKYQNLLFMCFYFPYLFFSSICERTFIFNVFEKKAFFAVSNYYSKWNNPFVYSQRHLFTKEFKMQPDYFYKNVLKYMPFQRFFQTFPNKEKACT